MQGDDHVGACMGNKPETVCYEEGNKGPFLKILSIQMKFPDFNNL